jgi:hypothetical protein
MSLKDQTTHLIMAIPLPPFVQGMRPEQENPCHMTEGKGLTAVMRVPRFRQVKLVEGDFNRKHLESVNALAAIIESKVAEARS